ncbi:Oligoendopeptidase F [Furfurilactobacillus rossiae]|uniref:Oligopeptidase F n=2 Tax=Furfurilactobacillus rossiae TaxID=231049 RepID=A0A0R1RHY8_9LACO|nr:oligopeptidase F [Furfurilactobacillus rossiae DSM 15814]QFR66645.1 oligoendopeptidase F [Furfurilactobacillus rossiae]QLE62119.1 Oligoendopeptidase F [Furfurilactobacillus rossiae]
MRIYFYANARNDSDTTDPVGTKLAGQAQSLYAQTQTARSFLTTEITALSKEKFDQYLKDEPRLKDYRRYLELNFLRNQGYVLPLAEEKLLAQSSKVFEGAENIFSMLNDGDMKYGDIEDENGETVELTDAKISEFMQSTNRDLRKRTSHLIKKAYDGLQHTFATTLSTHMEGTVLKNRAHHFATAREGELFDNEIPESVYDTLVATVYDHLQGEHDYMQLRQDVLGLKPMYNYDRSAPLLGDPKLKFTFDESKAIVLDALKVLGDDYLDGLRAEFSGSWIDAAENVGKRSGGYESEVYDVHPYILLNWSDNYYGLTTLAHESGHAMQSYFTDATQSLQDADYPIFTAEIASTTNENLLMDYMLDKYADNKEVKAYLLQQSIQTFIGTVNLQTLFAEFEHQAYEKVESDEALTSDYLSTMYAKLGEQYNGPAVTFEDEKNTGWAGVPHFYYNYYVYQYATSMAISTTIADRIYRKMPGALDQYKTFLKAGGSQAPIELIKQAGVDVTSRQYLDDAFAVLDKRIAELKEVLGK